MARVLLPLIQDLLDEEMAALVRAYLDIWRIVHFTNRSEETVEYLRRAVHEYTLLRVNPEGPLVKLGILPPQFV